MKAKQYLNPKEFWQEVSPCLRKEEAKNSLMLGLSSLFQTDPQYCIYQGALFENKELLGALLLSKYRTNNNLIVSPVKNQRSARILYETFLQSNNSVNSIIGEKETAEIYRGFFNERGKETSIHMQQGIYKCRKVNMPDSAPEFKFRLANNKDIKKIGTWIEKFQNEATPHAPPINGQSLAEVKIKNQMIYVLEKGGKILSMAGKGRDIETSCSINLVFTPKEWRGKGYGSIITATLTQELLSQGKKEINLYTDMSNLTSNKIYKNVGYDFVCNSIHVDINNP